MFPTGYKRDVDGATSASIVQLTGIPYKDGPRYAGSDVESAERLNGPLIERLKSGALESQDIRESFRQLWSLQLHAYVLLRRDSDARQFESILLANGMQAVGLEWRALREAHQVTKRQLRALLERARDATTLKIDLSLSAIGGVLGLVTTLFVVSGYLYNSFVYGALGMDVSLFFSISDYLATSIEKIKYVAISTALGTVSFFFGVNRVARNPHLALGDREATFHQAYVYVIEAAFATLAILQYFYGERYMTTIGLLLLIVGMDISPSIARRYFAKPMPATFSLVFIVTYTSVLVASVGGTIDDYSHKRFTQYNHVRVIPAKTSSLPANIKDSPVLGANSSYVFIYDVKSQKALAVPKGSIELIEIEQK